MLAFSVEQYSTGNCIHEVEDEMKLSALIFCCLFMLLGCSSPDLVPEKLPADIIEKERTKQFALSHQYQLQQKVRLLSIARPLLSKNTAACPKAQTYTLGVLMHRINDYPKEQRTAITELYNLDDRLQILHTLNNAPASRQFRKGDILLTIDQQRIIPDKATRQFKEHLKDGKDVTITFLRDNVQHEVTLTPELICSYPIQLSSSDSINGYADGSSIVITAGLMRFAAKDTELALIIAHEMAHNTQNHIGQRLGNSALGGLLDLVLISSGVPTPFVGTGLGANLHTQTYETEADIIGLHLMHNAGYDITGLADFWRKMAALHPQTITHGKQLSHPTTVERALRIEKEIIRLTN